MLRAFHATPIVHFSSQERRVREHVFLRSGAKSGDRRIATFNDVTVSARAALRKFAFFQLCHVIDRLVAFVQRLWGGRFLGFLVLSASPARDADHDQPRRRMYWIRRQSAISAASRLLFLS